MFVAVVAVVVVVVVCWYSHLKSSSKSSPTPNGVCERRCWGDGCPLRFYVDIGSDTDKLMLPRFQCAAGGG